MSAKPYKGLKTLITKRRKSSHSPGIGAAINTAKHGIAKTMFYKASKLANANRKIMPESRALTYGSGASIKTRK